MTPIDGSRSIHDQCVADILAERARQDRRWGVQHHGPGVWLAILTEEVGEVARATLRKSTCELRKELVQVAAVALAMLECGDRNGWLAREEAK